MEDEGRLSRRNRVARREVLDVIRRINIRSIYDDRVSPEVAAGSEPSTRGGGRRGLQHRPDARRP